MCIFKVENKRIGRKRNLVMHKMSCWKQKVFFSLKVTWILICTPHLQHGHRWLSCAGTGRGGKGRATISSSNQSQRNVLKWTNELPGLRVWGWPRSEHLPRHPSSLQQSTDVFPKLGPLYQDWSFACAPHSCGCEFSVEIKALVPKAGGWRLHVSHAAANQVPLFQYLADRSISSRDRKVL